VGLAAEYVLDCLAGQERAIPATKTYVACLAVSACLVADLAPGSELATGMDRIVPAVEAAAADAGAWLDGRGGRLLDDLAGADRALVISRGYNLSTAYETALKLKEACRVFASGYSSADVLHGPMVVAAPGIPVLAFRPDGPIGTSIDDAIAAAAARGIHPWLVGGDEVEGQTRALSLARDLPESLTPLPYAIMGQLLAERLAARLGISPDAPHGLSKVTRTL
jgi:glucosamine--fructose-6-phosphate aminotransferase (isomerizing)